METYFNIRYEFDIEAVHAAINRRLALPGSDYICVADGNILTEVHLNKEYRKILDNGMFSISDGSYVPIFLKYMYGKNYSKYCGPDLFKDIISQCDKRMIFIGSDELTLQCLKKQLYSYNPQIDSMKFIPLPFKAVSDFDYPGIARIINKDNADIIWVSLGAPKQEIFISKLQPYLDRGIMIGVGAAFQFFSGNKIKRAPQWVINAHFEFLFRIFQEPKKQIKRTFRFLKYIPIILFEEYQKKYKLKA